MFGGHNDATQPAQDTGVIAGTVPPDTPPDLPTADLTTPSPAPSGVLPTPSDLTPADTPEVVAPATGAPVVTPATTTDAGTDEDLLTIKQQALQQLSPLIGQLDQTPEDKFRTTMMMIQASDNQSLIKDAFTAAQQITDEKVRAQALLDIVNEINYFTQASQAPDADATADTAGAPQ